MPRRHASSRTGHGLPPEGLREAVGVCSRFSFSNTIEGADVKLMPVSQNGLSRELLEELAALAARSVPSVRPGAAAAR